PDSRLELADHGGVGWLRLCDHERRLASWRFTLRQLPAVQRFVERFAQVVATPAAIEGHGESAATAPSVRASDAIAAPRVARTGRCVASLDASAADDAG